MPMQRVAITGGAGFVGLRLAAALLDDAGLGVKEVRLLDVRRPVAVPFAPSTLRERRVRGCAPLVIEDATDGDSDIGVTGRLTYQKCDLRSRAEVLKALQGVDSVFHLASYGMSGRQMLDVPMIWAVNVVGTDILLDACKQVGVQRLVYVSTYNVVFGSEEIVNGRDDEVPYWPISRFHDEYSKTKRLAEEAVLRANSRTFSTCAIRPAAIYGDGEERHLPRILRTVRLGLGVAAIGTKDTLCDWLYVDNLSHALILSASSLSSRGPLSPAAGRAYCISDDAPTNNFAHLQPICAGLGYPRVFLFYVPTWLMFRLAWLMELLRLLLLSLSPRLAFQPFLTRAEVMKVGLTHYFSMQRARDDLAYAPVVEPSVAIQRCVEHYQEEFGRPAECASRAAR